MNDIEVLAQPMKMTSIMKVKNRFFKSAMSEALGSKEHAPTEELVHLYKEWAKGGAGIVVTGNVMIDERALGEPRNVVVEDERHFQMLKKWAEAGTNNNTQLWMQINHPGKQVFKGVVKEAVAPSAIPLSKEMQNYFLHPRELTTSEIRELIARFATTAKVAKKAGFTGVQIHAAHGYLISQFLSPRHNQRKDEWGGNINNRMRFLIEVYRAIRLEVGDSFPIGVKLNSADFVKAGFSEEDSTHVISVLASEKIDLIEISGGSYENPQMTGVNVKESTKKREAYFLEYAERIRKTVNVPLVVTGGFRSVSGMANAIRSNATDFIGIARPLAVYPDLPNKFLQGKCDSISLSQKKTGIKAIDQKALLEMSWYGQQLERIGKGRNPKPNFPPLLALGKSVIKNGREVFQIRRARD